MLELLSHNCKEKASFFLIVFFNLLIVGQKLLIERYNYNLDKSNLTDLILYFYHSGVSIFTVIA
ncbi:hypothetical protein X973_07240 [Piscirickettsia salmonis]|nr:hypothetical protein X973_07240 [Piscirickettsia salmonis]WGZ72657.1 hypothetical protein E3220_14430 [Piscirickettsia salmonis EM-90]